jgi:molybdopterin-containing oxidoreductase family iron-sulfur binding subunit
MPEQIPGVAVWYKTTCGECAAGCGLVVRTREGRAVKVEGNPEHPVNKGGVCALGQAGLQNLYDPDRVRQPLKIKRFGGSGEQSSVAWAEGVSALAKALKAGKGKQAIIAGELSGANLEVVREIAKAFDVEVVSYELFSRTAEAKAAEIVFGSYGVPTYELEKADVIVNFGADFLETWDSPVEHARSWADSRRKKAPAKFIHVEPRLSLTGANADMWLKSHVGTEELIALLFLKMVVQEKGEGVWSTVPESVKSDLQKACSKVSLEGVAEKTGIAKEKLLIVADDLSRAKHSVVIAGGAASYSENSLPLMVAVNALNQVLGNVGKTISIAEMKKPTSSPSQLLKLIEKMNKGELQNVVFWGTNPLFTLPASFGLQFAVKKVPTVFTLAVQLDETAAASDYILPVHSALESWGDSEPRQGVYNISQPTMLPLFDTKQAADVLISAALEAGAELSHKSFEDYLKGRWAKLHSSSVNKGLAFDVFWRGVVGAGGLFTPVQTDGASEGVANSNVKIAFLKKKTDHGSENTLTLFPYPSVRSFDGRAANRPWLQELPDPITQASWSSWAEIHPKSAQRFGLAQGDMVTLRTSYGEVTVPVYISEYVDVGIVAVPIGQGHKDFGRYAKSVGGGNVLHALRPVIDETSDIVALVGTEVEVKRSLATGTLPNAQGSDSQHGRELARTRLVEGAVAASGAAHSTAHAAHNNGDAHHGEGHHGHHEPKQMYEQRQHPLYTWGMAIDLAACTGCSACVVACYAENNIPVVGKEVVEQGREMAWLRIERYYEGTAEELKVDFMPMMCQHCQNAPCEPVCPVYATYHNEEGLNSMVYNRCVGTRYCSNNCSYKVRRFNWFEYQPPETLSWQYNPDVTKRSVGVMEKCTFCVQRISEAKDHAKDLGRLVEDGEVKPACVQSCPTQALVFGNLNDPNSKVSKVAKNERAYKVLDHHINTQPSVTYLEDIRVKA